MKPHKHAELIKAWADGAEIEYWESSRQGWTYTARPSWETDIDYRISSRIKPATITVTIPKPVLVNLESDLYMVLLFESVQDNANARSAIKELIK